MRIESVDPSWYSLVFGTLNKQNVDVLRNKDVAILEVNGRKITSVVEAQQAFNLIDMTTSKEFKIKIKFLKTAQIPRSLRELGYKPDTEYELEFKIPG